jgi:hypothetical protein
MARNAALGVANHTGWAHFVTVAWGDDEPVVVDRRRVVLLGEGLPKQPYEHEAGKLPRDEAQALIARVRASAETCALDALATLRAELSPTFDIAAIALKRQLRFDVLPQSVGEVLADLQFKYAADAMLFLEPLEAAARAQGLAVTRHAKTAEYDMAAARMGVGAADAEAWLKGLGKQLGPPWTAEHQRAAAAAIGLLG